MAAGWNATRAFAVVVAVVLLTAQSGWIVAEGLTNDILWLVWLGVGQLMLVIAIGELVAISNPAAVKRVAAAPIALVGWVGRMMTHSLAQDEARTPAAENALTAEQAATTSTTAEESDAESAAGPLVELERAREQASAGNTDQAIAIAYGAVREPLSTEVQPVAPLPPPGSFIRSIRTWLTTITTRHFAGSLSYTNAQCSHQNHPLRRPLKRRSTPRCHCFGRHKPTGRLPLRRRRNSLISR